MTPSTKNSSITDRYIRAASLADVQAKGSLLVHLDKQAREFLLLRVTVQMRSQE